MKLLIHIQILRYLRHPIYDKTFLKYNEKKVRVPLLRRFLQSALLKEVLKLQTILPIILENSRGMQISIDPVGAALKEVSVCDRSGKFLNIALCSIRPEGPRADGSYAGATLAPCAGRIAGGRLTIDGKEYALTQNDGGNHLHGGSGNLSFVQWEFKPPVRASRETSLTLYAAVKDGQDGYPGNRTFFVTYTLDDDNSLTIRYRTVTDKPTYVSLSNHAYWNLSGDFTASAMDHLLQIDADQVYFNGREHLPVETHGVKGTPFDFQTSCSISQQTSKTPDHPQFSIARGYNNAYILSGKNPAATLYEPASGRRLQLYTDYPSLVFYSGGFLDGSTVMKHGVPAASSCALALEAQELPNAFTLPGLVLHPGQVRERFIRYAFDCV